MHNFTEKNVRDNILAGGNAWVKWKCVSCEMHEPWHHRRILQQIGGGKLRQSPKGRGGVRVIGEGAVSSFPTKQEVWGLRGSTVNSLSRVRGRAPAAKRFFCILVLKMASPDTSVVLIIWFWKLHYARYRNTIHLSITTFQLHRH